MPSPRQERPGGRDGQGGVSGGWKGRQLTLEEFMDSGKF